MFVLKVLEGERTQKLEETSFRTFFEFT